MAHDWIQSWSGKRVEPLALKPEQVGTIEEIAHALSCKVRFQGHTTAPYSVAEHCVRGSQLLSPAFAGAFLLHEISEVYLPDVPSPIKPFLRIGDDIRCRTWYELERQHATVMLDALGLSSVLPLLDSPEVKRMDLAMLGAEASQLLAHTPEWIGDLGVEPAPVRINAPWSSETAEGLFLSRFAALFRVT